MKRYYKVMLGEKRKYADLCHDENFIGAYYRITEDLSNILLDDKDLTIDEIKKTYINYNNDKSKIAIGLDCGQLWKICKGINIDDIVISPDSSGTHYYVGKIVSNYCFVNSNVLPHRRNVEWFNTKIERKKMSDGLKKTTKSLFTVTDITKYANEIKALLQGNNVLPPSNPTSITGPNYPESSYEIAHQIKKIIVQINKNQKNRDKDPIFQDINTMKIWSVLEEPCKSDNDFIVFSLKLYILIYEKTRKYLNRDNYKEGFKFLLPDQFLLKGTSTRHFFDIVGTLRHEYAHEEPDYNVPFNKLGYKNILNEILKDTTEPPEDFYKFQIELFKRFEKAMKKLLEIVKNDR